MRNFGWRLSLVSGLLSNQIQSLNLANESHALLKLSQVEGIAMFERFTEKAIKVIMLSHEEAHRLGHKFIGAELILVGLVGEGTGIAAKVLRSMGVDLKSTRTEIRPPAKVLSDRFLR